jgi:hypothetical protein
LYCFGAIRDSTRVRRKALDPGVIGEGPVALQ